MYDWEFHHNHIPFLSAWGFRICRAACLTTFLSSDLHTVWRRSAHHLRLKRSPKCWGNFWILFSLIGPRGLCEKMCPIKNPHGVSLAPVCFRTVLVFYSCTLGHKGQHQTQGIARVEQGKWQKGANFWDLICAEVPTCPNHIWNHACYGNLQQLSITGQWRSAFFEA